MKLRSKLVIGAVVGLVHFASYLACISAVVANDANGESNSYLLAATVKVLGLPLMAVSSTARHVLASIGLSETGRFAGELALAGVNSLIWAGAIVGVLNFLHCRISSSNHSPEPTPGAVH